MSLCALEAAMPDLQRCCCGFSPGTPGPPGVGVDELPPPGAVAPAAFREFSPPEAERCGSASGTGDGVPSSALVEGAPEVTPGEVAPPGAPLASGVPSDSPT